MTPEPLWRRMARRPAWERDDPPKPSDYDPAVRLHIAVNRIRAVQDRGIAQLARLSDRLDEIEAARREARRKR